MKTPEKLLFEIDQLRVKYRRFDIETSSLYVEKAIELIEKFRKNMAKKSFDAAKEWYNENGIQEEHHNFDVWYNHYIQNNK